MTRSQTMWPHSRRPLLALACAVLAYAGIGAGWRAQAQNGDSPERAAELSVSVSKVRPLCFQDRLEVTGVIAAREIVEVTPDGEGLRVSQILVEPLEEVAQGQVLARLARPDEGGGATASAPVRAPVAGVPSCLVCGEKGP